MMRIGALLRRQRWPTSTRWYAAGRPGAARRRATSRTSPPSPGDLLAELGFDPALVDAAIADPTTSDEVLAEHQRVVDAGGYGVPTLFFPDGQCLFGPVLIDPPTGRGGAAALGRRRRLDGVPAPVRAPAAEDAGRRPSDRRDLPPLPGGARLGQHQPRRGHQLPRPGRRGSSRLKWTRFNRSPVSTRSVGYCLAIIGRTTHRCESARGFSVTSADEQPPTDALDVASFPVMWSATRRSGAAAVLAAGIVLIAPSALSPALPLASADDCPDVEVTFARGTDEPAGLGRVGQALVDSLREQTGMNIGAYAVDYKASLLQLHTDAGSKDAVSHIKSMADKCPNTPQVWAATRRVRR